MTRFSTKRKLLFLLSALTSRTSALAFTLTRTAPSRTSALSIHHQKRCLRQKSLLHARFRRKEDDDEINKSSDGTRRGGRRLSFFSAFSSKRERRAKVRNKMQASATVEMIMGGSNGTDSSRAWTSVGTKYVPIRKKTTSTTSFAGSNGTATMALPFSTSTATTALPPPPQAALSPDTKTSAGALTRMTGQWFQSILLSILLKRSVEPPTNLQIKAIPTGNVLANLVKGRYRSNFQLSFDSVKFPNIQISGGGRIDAKRLALNVWSFTPQLLRQGTYRFPKQFDLVARNCTLLEKDLLESSCIRNGLGRLLVRILKRAGNISTRGVTITDIQVLPSNKISVLGHATTIFGSRVVFEVRSGIGTACRGHVLTFPGLEVSLQPALGVFVPVVPSISLDIGHNAHLSKLSINGELRQVSLGAHVSITPQHTIKMSKRYTQSKEAYLAQFSFDVGQWITHIGNFTL